MNHPTALLALALLLLALLASACRPCASPAACTDRGYELHQKGKLKLALSYYQHGCNGGNELGCSNLGIMYFYGQGTQKDVGRAEEAWQEACDDGHAVSCDLLGLARLERHGEKADAEVWPLLQSGCTRGWSQSCREAAEVARRRGEPGLPWLLRACDADDGWSCLRVGLQHINGVEVPISQERAFAFFNRASALGQSSAFYWMGMIQLHGRDGSPNPEAALSFFRLGCEQGEPWSCYRAGKILMGGIAGAPDPKGAGQLWWQSCHGFHASACGEVLRVKPWTDPGWTPRTPEALAALGEACAGKDNNACLALGLSYLTGADGQENAIIARELFLQLCTRTGDHTACALHDQLNPGVELAPTACADSPDCIPTQVKNGKVTIKDTNVQDSIKKLTPQCEVQPWGVACGLLAAVLSSHPDLNRLDEALNAARRGCQSGDGYGCSVAGDILSEPGGRAFAPEEAVEHYAVSCRYGSAYACGKAAQIRCGDLQRCDDQAFMWIAIAVRLAPSIQTLRAYADRLCALDRLDEAKATFEEACKLGDNTACGRTCAGPTL